MRILAGLGSRNHDTSSTALAVRASVAGLAAALVLTAMWPSAPAHAQGAVPCTAITDDAERLACYDRALRPAPAPAAQSRSAAPPAAAAASDDEDGRRRERRIRESAAPVAPAAPAAPAARSAPPAGAPPGDEIVALVVVDVRALPGRPATFMARDGSAWVQTDSQRLTVPDAPFDAEIKRGAMGSYFLVPKDRRAIRVRPAER